LNKTRLSVNVNKVALLRNTRHLGIPSVTRAAEICLQAGAAGITVHPRPDERHIRAHDVIKLAELMQHWPDREYNIEGNPLHNLIDCIADLKRRNLPVHQATFVPDSVAQFTSDHGWRFPADAQRVSPLVKRCQEMGVRVSLFMDPEPAQMQAARDTGAERVELYTETFASAHERGERGTTSVLHQHFAPATLAAAQAGLAVNAGHDLNLHNLTDFLKACPQVEEVSIGHALIGDALELGYAETVRRYLACIDAAFVA
jgi:pyridoxine 5-phosphate synthase